MNDFEQGNIHYMAKEYYEASECYRRFLEQEPNNYCFNVAYASSISYLSLTSIHCRTDEQT